MNSSGAARLRREGTSATAGASNLSNIRSADDDPSAAEKRAALNSARLEQLLAQIDEHSLALVPTRRIAKHEPPPQPRFHPYLLAFLVCWITASAVGIVYIRTLHPAPPPQIQVVERPNPPAALEQQREVEGSIGKMADRINQLEEQLAALRRQEKQQQQPPAQPRPSTATTTVAVVRKPNLPLPPPHLSPMPAPQPPLASAPPAPLPVSAASASVAVVEPPPPQQPQTNLLATFGASLNLQPTKSSVPHHSAMGTLDFWLVPRGELARADRALPIGSNSQGVIIHDIDDGKEYTVTPLGDWKPASTPDPRPPQP